VPLGHLTLEQSGAPVDWALQKAIKKAIKKIEIDFISSQFFCLISKFYLVESQY
jgi:hypothetical protein